MGRFARRRQLARSRLVAAVAAVLAVAGIATTRGWPLLAAAAVMAVLWPAARRAELRARRRDAYRAGRPAWDLFAAGPSPLRGALRTRPASATPAMRGNARLLFVELDHDAITLDGLLGRPGATAAQVPFWLRVRPPAPSWMRAAIVTLVRRWAADGSAVAVETRPVGGGYQAILSADGTRMVLDVEEAGGLVDAA